MTKFKKRKIFISALLVLALAFSFFMPTIVNVLQDHYSLAYENNEEILYDLPTDDGGVLNVSGMLRMVSTSDVGVSLQRGKYRQIEDVSRQAQISLTLLEQEGLDLPISSYELNNYSIYFLIDRTDMSQRMIVWVLEYLCADGSILHMLLDDNTGTVLGLDFYTTQANIEHISAPLIQKAFSSYWDISISSTTLSSPGQYYLSFYENTKEASFEIPLTFDSNGFSLNNRFL